MADKSMNTISWVALTLAVVAGLLALSRAVYNYTQHGSLDIGKIAIGIAFPCLIYVIVKSASSRK